MDEADWPRVVSGVFSSFNLRQLPHPQSLQSLTISAMIDPAFLFVAQEPLNTQLQQVVNNSLLTQYST